MQKEEDFLSDILDDEKTITFIKGYLPQDLKDKFSNDNLYYFLDLIDDYYSESGILDAKPDSEGYLEVNLESIAQYIVKEAKKDDVGEFEVEDILFVVQGDLEYAESL